MMIKHFYLVLIVMMGLYPRAVPAQQIVNVVILPFKIYAQKDLSYLQTDIPSALKKFLEQAGARVLFWDIAFDPSWKKRVESLDEIKKLGLQTGADYLIWGSLTWIGQQFSLDAKLFATFAEKSPVIFSVEGQGIENLPGTVEKLAQDLSLKIFRRQTVVAVNILGNQRIEVDAIKKVIKTQPGDPYNLKSLSEDLKAIYALGYFDDIQIEADTGAGGKIVTFKVKEKPTLQGVRVSGNTWVFDDEEIKEVLSVKRGSILNIHRIKNDVNRIEELYYTKNYHNVKVDYKIYERKNNQADLEFIIQEGDKVWITKILFEGNKSYSDKKLKGLMASSEKNIFSWFTTAGDLNQENLDQDFAKLTSFYHNNGYIKARIGEPQIEFKGNAIEITIKVEEGPQFKVGKVALRGDLILPEKQLVEKIKIADEEFYNRKILRSDVLVLEDLYSDEGYAYADISPRVDQDPDKLVVDITFEIGKGKQVYFEQIIISGNTKTRDKVIRRELRVYEQELFSGKRLKRSIRNLYRLDYFEDVKVNTSKGSSDDKMVLKIDVTEKSTGAFSVGAGFGNVENFFGVASISERNLFGRGQTLELKGILGSKTQKYILNFTEPYIYDIPLSGTIGVYNWDYELDDYDKKSIGGSLKFGYPVFDFTRVFLSYLYDISDITNIGEDAANSIKELEGELIKSSLSTQLRYDSRNQAFVPTRGSNHSISFEFAGLGGDVGFTKYTGETAWYIPLFWGFTGVAHAEGGFVKGTPGKTLPDYEKFFMGGIGSLRGFKRDDLSPRDDQGAEVGGDKFVQFNFEVTFPLVKQQGVYGVVFFDTGEVYGDDEKVDLRDLRQSAGGGIRWRSPVGPIRIEYGYILDRKDTDHGVGSWEISMASAF